VRHRPGPGLALGLAGLVLLLLSLTVLPWVSEGGEDASFGDIRDAFDAADDYGTSVEPAMSGVRQQELPPIGEPVEPPIPEYTVPEYPTPSPSATSSETDFIELYVDLLWISVVVMGAVAVLFATWAVPRSKSGRMVTGFLIAGVVGLAINAADEEGTVGPRVSGALVTLLAGGLHTFAVFDMYGDDYAPDPAWGVWAGFVGLLLVLIGCVMGTRIDRSPAYG
jgi:hypothetical protein